MSDHLSGLRVRAHLDPGLPEIVARWIGCQRVIYNAKVSEDRLFAAQRRLLLRDAPDTSGSTPLDQAYAHFKDPELTPWLAEVPSQVLRNGAVRWRQAKQRQLQGLAKAPRIRRRADFNSVWLTNELFRFIPLPGPTGTVRHAIEIGTVANPLGRIHFKTDRPYTVPSSITLRLLGSGRWVVSFNFHDPAAAQTILRAPEELAYELNQLDDTALGEAVLALDRNIAANCLADSRGRQYGFTPAQQERLARKAVGRQRHQRKLARQQKGSKNHAKTKRKIAKSYEYGGNVRRNFAHQVSHALVKEDHRAFAFEGLKIQNMVRRPKAKQDAAGRWQHNGARAKAGLNAGILGAAWGLSKQFLGYKAARRNQLVVSVAAAYSSQECSQCGHTHPDNRDGSRFVCRRCGFAYHADINAALVQKKRAIALIRSRVLETPAKPKKRVAFMRKKPAGADSPGVSVEPCVSRPVPAGSWPGTRQATKQKPSCAFRGQETRR